MGKWVMHGYQTYADENERDLRKSQALAYMDTQKHAKAMPCNDTDWPAGIENVAMDGLPGFTICYNLQKSADAEELYAGLIAVINPDDAPSQTGQFHTGWAETE